MHMRAYPHMHALPFPSTSLTIRSTPSRSPHRHTNNAPERCLALPKLHFLTPRGRKRDLAGARRRPIVQLCPVDVLLCFLPA